MGENNRTVRLLQATLGKERAEAARQLQIAEHKLELARADGRGKDVRIAILEAKVEEERILRAAAQRGLVRYMRENGLGDKVGYDPDQDPTLSARP